MSRLLIGYKGKSTLLDKIIDCGFLVLLLTGLIVFFPTVPTYFIKYWMNFALILSGLLVISSIYHYRKENIKE